MALIKCPECGHDLSDSAVFCPHCGFQTNNAKQDPPPKSLDEQIEEICLLSQKDIYEISRFKEIIFDEIDTIALEQITKRINGCVLSYLGVLSTEALGRIGFAFHEHANVFLAKIKKLEWFISDNFKNSIIDSASLLKDFPANVFYIVSKTRKVLREREKTYKDLLTAGNNYQHLCKSLDALLIIAETYAQKETDTEKAANIYKTLLNWADTSIFYYEHIPVRTNGHVHYNKLRTFSNSEKHNAIKKRERIITELQKLIPGYQPPKKQNNAKAIYVIPILLAVFLIVIMVKLPDPNKEQIDSNSQNATKITTKTNSTQLGQENIEIEKFPQNVTLTKRLDWYDNGIMRGFLVSKFGENNTPAYTYIGTNDTDFCVEEYGWYAFDIYSANVAGKTTYYFVPYGTIVAPTVYTLQNGKRELQHVWSGQA